jgi:hypothetical protein
MKLARQNFSMTQELLDAIRATATRERRQPGAVLERWAELGRRAELSGAAPQVEAAWREHEAVK